METKQIWKSNLPWKVYPLPLTSYMHGWQSERRMLVIFGERISTFRGDNNPFMPSGLSYNTSISSRRDVWVVFNALLLIEIPILKAVYTPLDLGLRYLLMSLLWDAKHKCVKNVFTPF